MANVQEINNKIRIEGNKIAEKLKLSIKAFDCPIKPSTKTSSNRDVSSRSWLMNIIKDIKNRTDKGKTQNVIDYDAIKSTTIEKCNKQLDIAKEEWNKIMNDCKNEIQSLIHSACISEDKKTEYLSYTYYPETLDLSTLELIDDFDSIAHDENFTNVFLKAKDSFAEKIEQSLITSINKQITEYANINI